jgi:hypothetical protein
VPVPLATVGPDGRFSMIPNENEAGFKFVLVRNWLGKPEP